MFITVFYKHKDLNNKHMLLYCRFKYTR